MSKRIIGLTVGTPLNPDKFKGEGGGGNVKIVQEPGDSETAVMSQKAVTTVLGPFGQALDGFQTNIDNTNNELASVKTILGDMLSDVDALRNQSSSMFAEFGNIYSQIGDIDSVLDAIIARQNSYIGGGT